MSIRTTIVAGGAIALAWTTGLATLPQDPPKPLISALREVAATLQDSHDAAAG